MLDIKDIKGLGGEELLKSYEGRNPYINYMKKKYLSEKSYFLTTNQSKYVKKFFNFEPRSMNKVIELTNYFAEQLKEEYKLKVPIKKILIETLLAESDKALHVICKFYKNQKDVKLLWIPKTQLIEQKVDYVEAELQVLQKRFSKIKLTKKIFWWLNT